jgi:Sulfotransferase domain
MGLKIVGSGFGRTGTMSLKRALEQLAFGPCHHMEELLLHSEQIHFWQGIVAGRTMNWEEVFAGYNSQVDWPGAHVWQDLAAAYPQAKVIQTVRPEKHWWKSFSQTIAALLTSDQQMAPPPHIVALTQMATEMISTQTFGGSMTDKEVALAAYRRRTDEVRAAIPPGRLLVFDVAEGWQPLCRFLEVAVPSTPFPRLNSTEDWWRRVKGEPN